MGDAPLDLVGDVRNDLNGLAQIYPVALVFEHLLIDLSTGRRIGPAQLGVGEALIMSQVEIRLGSIVQHVHLTMLVRAHGARIDVQIRIELLECDGQAAILQQGSERRRGEALAEGAHDAARDEDVLHGMLRSQGADPCIKENFPAPVFGDSGPWSTKRGVEGGFIRGRSIFQLLDGGGSGPPRILVSG